MSKPLDMPDDYIWLPGSGKSPMQDVGELAVRLGSPISYDRRGSVYWYDDFENGLGGFLKETLGTGASIRYSTAHVFSGSLSAKLTAGDTNPNYARIRKWLAPALNTAYGFECTFSLDANVVDINFQFIQDFGSKRLVVAADINPSQQLFTLTNGVYGVLFSKVVSFDPNNLDQFSTMKFVVNNDTLEAVRAQFNDNEYDLSGITLGTIAGVPPDGKEIIATVISNPGTNGTIHIDNMIVTIGDE